MKAKVYTTGEEVKSSSGGGGNGLFVTLAEMAGVAGVTGVTTYFWTQKSIKDKVKAFRKKYSNLDLSDDNITKDLLVFFEDVEKIVAKAPADIEATTPAVAGGAAEGKGGAQK